MLRCDEKSNSTYAYITTESVLLKKGKSLLPQPTLTDYALAISEENRHNLTIELTFKRLSDIPHNFYCYRLHLLHNY